MRYARVCGLYSGFLQCHRVLSTKLFWCWSWLIEHIIMKHVTKQIREVIHALQFIITRIKTNAIFFSPIL
jgi:hypothetical protein